MHLISRETERKDSREALSPEQRLIELCKQGDRASQKRIYDSLAPKMFAICIRYMGNRDDAEDILQEGFVTLFQKIGSFSGEGSFEGWARKIFVNTALMALRRTDALKLSDDISEAWGVTSESASQIQTIGYKELMKLIADLPAGYRTVFNMYVIEGYTHKEIGDALGISDVTSRSQLQRARTILQEKITELYGEQQG
ncbi:MAG: sigma-70 family RNA polymerase sigma factor [Bacteroidales bacterium]|nr:sigma-70 family RNA polymerase sigma factor [Bacteroidales bacterium]